MSNEINNVNNQSKVQPKNNNDKKMTVEEAAKIVYEESIFGIGGKIHKTLTEDIPEKILEKSQSWAWVQKLQEFFGIETKENKHEPKNKE